MGIIDNLLKSIGYGKIATGAVTERVPLTMAADYAWERDPSYLLRNDELYTKIGWIFSATNAVAEFSAAQKLHVKREDGEELTDIPNHPLERLIRRPNPLMSRAEFIASSASYYILSHNCYWWINAPTETGEPVELWIIPPGQITPVCDEKLFIKGYEYIPYTGATILIPPEQIVHIKRFNPNNPFQGAGLYETVKYQTISDYGANRNQALQQTENNGAPPGLLAFADRIVDTEWDRLKLELSAAAQKMMKYLPLRGVGAGGVQWLPNSLSDREMQVIEKRAFTRDEIYQIIAPGYLNMMLPNATEANAKTGKATFTEFVIYPLLNAFAEKITNDLLPRYGESLVCEFDEVRTKDKVLELQEIAAYERTHTVAEVRKKYYGDDPLGDDRDNLFPVQVNAQTGDGSEPEPEPEVVVQPITPPMLEAQNPQAAPAENQGESEPIEDDAEQMAEVKRWKRVAKKALKAGKPIPEFTTTLIPRAEYARMQKALAGCMSAEDVDAVFITTDPQEAQLQRIANLLEKLAA